MRRLLTTFALLTLSTAACTTTRVLSAEDHGGMPITRLELVETSFMVFANAVEHVFLMCRDQGSDLVCHRVCGGAASDLQCPTSTTSDGITSSNVR